MRVAIEVEVIHEVPKNLTDGFTRSTACTKKKTRVNRKAKSIIL